MFIDYCPFKGRWLVSGPDYEVVGEFASENEAREFCGFYPAETQE